MRQVVLAASITTLLVTAGCGNYQPISNEMTSSTNAGVALETDFLTYFGGSNDDRCWSIAVDPDDNIYITGYTESADFPLLNPLDATLNSTDIFVAKFSPNGELVYSTLIGGSNSDRPESIEVDSKGNVYIAGRTYSQDFPIVNAYDSSIEPGNPPYSYGRDGFILKLNSSGNGIIYSTYMGGSERDSIYDLTIDSENNVYVVGQTSSPDFPLTENAFDKSYEHFSEGFVTKLDSTGQSLIYSSFIGAEKNEFCSAIALDSDNDMYMTGTTQSAEFPTKNAYSTAFSDDQDCCFVLKLSAAGALEYSTHVGGTAAEFPDGDSAVDIAVDTDGNAYVSGVTDSVDFPLVNAFVDTVAANQDGFIFKLGSKGDDLLYSSYIGGDYTTAASDIVVDDTGIVFLPGFTWSDSFEALGGNSTFGGGTDGLIFLIAPNGTLLYSSYFGGSENDDLGAVSIDSNGRYIVVGTTDSDDLPAHNSHDETYNGPFDAYVTAFTVHEISQTASTTETTSTGNTSTTGTNTSGLADTILQFLSNETIVIVVAVATILIIAVILVRRKPSS